MRAFWAAKAGSSQENISKTDSQPPNTNRGVWRTDSEDAIYPFNLADETGKPLDGGIYYVAFGKANLTGASRSRT